MTQRDTTTDRLAKIIQVLQMGKKTGTLSVERGVGRSYEEGVISFVQGRVVEAKTHYLQGMAALMMLESWGVCRYAFIVQESGGESQMPQASQGPFPSSRQPPDTIQQPGNMPLALPSQSQERANHTDGSLPYTTIPMQVMSFAVATQVLANAGLSRLHLRVFLLINGQRTLSELALLVGRSPHELIIMLKELEQIGAIRFRA